ncbi:MAG: gluconokinase [Acidobacteria bacterium]|nr:gluconokinase [Acidobacteriota bacterium]
MADRPQKMILALDVGSSSVRAGLYDMNAQMLPRMSATLAHEFERTADGGSQMDAEECFCRVADAIDVLLEKSERVGGEIAAVAACTFWHSLMGIDAKGRPTTKLLGWADTRSRTHTPLLREAFDERAAHDRTGAHFHSSFWPAKLLWLRNENPDAWKRTERWASFADFAAMKLSGEPATSVSMASGTGVFDQRTCEWDRPLLKYLKVPLRRLPRIAADDGVFRLTPKFARRWPRLANAVWLPAIGDGAADSVGAGCTEKGRAALMVGTSAAMRIAFRGKPPKRIPQGLWCYRIDRERVVIGGALSDGGNLYALIKKRFGLGSDAEELLAAREAADGLVVVPFFYGERSTGYDEAAGGAIIGMTAEHDGIDVLRAAMEGVAFRLADIFERLQSVGKMNEIIASGGALRASRTWTQIIADTLGRDIKLAEADEASSKGAVMLAIERLKAADFRSP